jgi:energy-coupling factor transport system ATP-binding protein
MVSHSMEDVARLADRIAVMHHGRLALEGTPEAVFALGPRLREIGLDVPEVVRLRAALAERGLTLPGDIRTPEAMASALRARWEATRAQ